MSTKYNTGSDSRIVTGQDGRAVALTDHAIDRWRLRTPADVEIGIHRAWQLGDHIKHPGVASSDDEPDPDAAVVFHHSDGWGVTFLVVDDGQPVLEHEAARVVVSTYAFKTYEHAPSAAYLRAYGPHDLGGQQ